MAVSRKVQRTGKDQQREITRLCGDSFVSVSKADAISQIERGEYRYYVIVAGAEVDVKVAHRGTVKYLRNDPTVEQPY